MDLPFKMCYYTRIIRLQS